jgi:nitrogen-specific signal transduction histidine kinase
MTKTKKLGNNLSNDEQAKVMDESGYSLSIEKFLKAEDGKARLVLGALPGKIIVFDESFNIVESFNGLQGELIKLDINGELTRSVNLDFQTKFIASINKLQQKRGAKYFKEDNQPGNVEYFNFKKEDLEKKRPKIYSCSVSCTENNLWVLHLFEITEKYYHDEAKRKEGEQISNIAKMSSIGEMAAGIAHEVNNPLHIITGLSNKIKKQILQSKGNSEEIIDYVGRIEMTVQRISKIVTGFSQLAQKDSAEELETFNFFEMISEVLKLNGDKYFSKDIAVSTVMDEELCVKGRRVPLSQVIMNYLDNSYDAIKDLDERWIEVRVQCQNGIVKLSVVDSGKGIPDQVANKIFDPFFTTKPLGQGTGLGISISKQIVEAHGGKVGYELVDGHTSFYFEIPYNE